MGRKNQETKYHKKHIIDAPESHPIYESYFEERIDMDTAFTTNDLDVFHSMLHNDAGDFSKSLTDQLELSKFGMSIGSIKAYVEESCDLFEPVYSNIDDFKSKIDTTQVTKAKPIYPEFLSKIWNINTDLSAKTRNKITRLNHQGYNNCVSQNFSTNDHMLHYKSINSQFFTDTLFATEEGKLRCGNTCSQIFLSDKVFVAVYPIYNKSHFESALHKFCKDIGVSYTLVVDSSGYQTKKFVCRFCHQVGTTLNILEESTQWANNAEL